MIGVASQPVKQAAGWLAEKAQCLGVGQAPIRNPQPESTFATVRHRTKITRGPSSRAAGLAMAFKLIEAAQARWRAVNAPHLVALVRAGSVFEAGKLVERPDEPAQPKAA